MKSDKEFLEGIYQKAEKYKETSMPKKKKHNLYTKSKRALPFAIAAVLALALLPYPIRQWIETGNKKTDVEQYNNARQQQRELDNPSPANAARQMSISIQEIVYGEITNVEIKNDITNITITVEQAYSGYIGEELSFSYYDDSNTSYERPRFEVGEKALFYLEETPTGFAMSTAPNGKCKLIKEEDGVKQFEALDGSVITEDSLSQPD